MPRKKAPQTLPFNPAKVRRSSAATYASTAATTSASTAATTSASTAATTSASTAATNNAARTINVSTQTRCNCATLSAATSPARRGSDPILRDYFVFSCPGTKQSLSHRKISLASSHTYVLLTLCIFDDSVFSVSDTI